MHLRRAQVFCLRIPFVERFAHSLSARQTSDAVVVRIEADDGTVGYGEGLPRSYVTGESVASVLRWIGETIWPTLREAQLPSPHVPDLLEQLGFLLDGGAPNGEDRAEGILGHHAARCAVELALADCCLKRMERSLADLLPAPTNGLCYSGVISAGSVDETLRQGRLMQRFGLSHIKIKVGDDKGVERVTALRELMGPAVSIRVDANGAWTLEEAVAQLEAMVGQGVESCEEPLGRARRGKLSELCRRSPVPIMLDESLVSLGEGRRLAELGACQLFNLRLSKCGGLSRTLDFVELARAHDIGFQIGAHVGETSLLSAAGRHLAASLPDLRYLEGSYGTLLLSEDIASPSVRFGYRGSAPFLKGAGLGVKVQDERLNRYAERVVELS